MKLMHKRTLVLLIGIIAMAHTFAQQCTVMFKSVAPQVLYDNALFLAEAKVVSKTATWDIGKKNIYTVYTLSVYTQLKGNGVPSSIAVAFLGGSVGNDLQISSSSPSIAVGDEGFFYIKTSKAQLVGYPQVYTTVGAVHGAVVFDKRDQHFTSLFQHYHSKYEFLQEIQSFAKAEWKVVTARPIQPSISNATIAGGNIASLTPTTITAGTQSVLTIRGTGFGATQGSVEFPDADDGGASFIAALPSQLLSWSDTEITVQVPSGAGTGRVRVRNGGLCESPSDLTVSYNYSAVIDTGRSYEPIIVDRNFEGGLTFNYHTDFDTSPAKAPFEEAFELWNCQTQLNLNLGGAVTTVDVAENDGRNIVRFDNGAELPLGVLGQVQTRFTRLCDASGQVTVREMDIVWDDATNWHFGNTLPSPTHFDFKSIALHELGHAHQLGHVIEPADVMHFSIGAGESKFTLTPNAVAGGQFTVGKFLGGNSCGEPSMTAGDFCCANTTIAQNPEDVTTFVGQTEIFEVRQNLVDTYQWQINEGGGWTNLSDNMVYSGVTTPKLTVTGVTAGMDSNQFRCLLNRSCGDQLITTAATLTIGTGTERIAIPDANFEQQLIDLGIDTNGLTGDILSTDALAVTALTVTRTDITDFTGLEGFRNVVDLNLGTNQVPTLPLDNLLELETLEFRNNDALTALNLNNNTKLRVLDIVTGVFSGGIAPITRLDLSNLINLERVRISGFQQMDALLFPSTDQLEEIRLGLLNVSNINLFNQNQLRVLEIGGSVANPTDITYPQVTTVLEEIALTSFNLPTVDVSAYTNLRILRLAFTGVEILRLPTTPTFERLDVSSHNLQNLPLDFSIVPNLEQLRIVINQSTPLDIDITQNPDLEQLRLGVNDMTTLDVTQNPNLRILDVNTNELTALDVTQNPVLRELQVHVNRIPAIDVTNNPELRSFNAAENLLTAIDLTLNPELTFLTLSDNQLTTIDTSQNPDLFSFRANTNQIAVQDITQNPNLTFFEMTDNLLSGNSILEQFFELKRAQRWIRNGRFKVSRNNLSGRIPDFTTLVIPAAEATNSRSTTQFEFEFEGNRFEFGDFETEHAFYEAQTAAQAPNSFGTLFPIFTSYRYAPQQKVNDILTTAVNAGDPITLTTIVSGEANHYRWFKDGTAIVGAPDSPEYTIDAFTDCDAGVYYAEVDSDRVPITGTLGENGKNLRLTRNDITLSIVGEDKRCTTITLPTDGATNVPINSGIQWEARAGACGYRVNIGTTPGGTDVVSNREVEDTTFNYENDFPANQQLYITIVPFFDDGDVPSCTETTFTTSASSTVPLCTRLTTPINGATDIAVTTDLEWDIAPSAESYVLNVGTTSGGVTLVDNVNVGNVTTYDFTTDLPANSTIYVTIIPVNAEGNAMGCTEEIFTTITVPTVPPCTTLSGPVNGATDVIEDTNLSWNAVASASGYRISIGTSAGGVDLLDSEDVGNTTTYDPPTNFPKAQEIFVTIVPYTAVGNAIGCTEERFTTQTLQTIPSCTTVTEPANGAIDVSTTGIEIQWEAVATAEGYRISIGTDTNPVGIENRLDVGNETRYRFSTPALTNTTYVVSVVPYNAAGEAQTCTPTRFTTTLLNLAERKFGISPNGDGVNDFWEIQGIENFPDNTVSIYNRWGDLVYETQGYDNTTQRFVGDANRSKGIGADQLPNGTYFFQIEVNTANASRKSKGFIIIKR